MISPDERYINSLPNLFTCAHCGQYPIVTWSRHTPTVAERHVCMVAVEDWIRLDNPNLYGWLMPYTPTMQLMTSLRLQRIQAA